MRTVVALAALCLIAGCATSPESAIVGVWTADPRLSSFPKLPDPEISDRAEAALNNFMLKVRSDNSAVLSSGAAAEGTWKLKGHELLIKLSDSPARGPLGNESTELNGTFDADFRKLTINQDTPLGTIKIVLIKTA